MRMVDLIARKKAGGALTADETRWWINGYVHGEIPDYQVSAMLMAICFRGMSQEETVAMTMAMAHSGDVADLSAIEGIKVDKHSTGGVGDTTTLIVAPVVAACGVKVAKMSGRGLGHTGGTVDKLESVPGFNVSLEPEEFAEIVNRVGLAVTGQSSNLVPADKKLYALRDVTATVDSIPLIASSIMSKKLAAGADAIVLDVKSGSGAFMRTLDGAFALAEEMVRIGQGAGRRTVALVTDMDQPLGMSIGNSLEVMEAIHVLSGRTEGLEALRSVSLMLAQELLMAAGRTSDRTEALAMAEEAIVSGRALQAFRHMIEAQGGNPEVADCTELLPQAEALRPVRAQSAGYVTGFDTEEVGRAAIYLGAGRSTKEDAIDYAAGFILKKRVGDRVEAGDILAVLHVGKTSNACEAEKLLLKAIHIGDEHVTPNALVFGRVTESGTERF